ncbi:DoxX family protein [Horticoccus luteus]|uniref:DoxX family protein n=1 Tax=Horticoccus luteus TaxID=2862869 RepID=A0A8F9XIN7_9BACT|nr:DoxX family protein [Horticoccus luteus]QYM77783.1 DoxX family protein [Horticoccus luteus]
MKSFLKILQINYIPRSPDFALLVLRVWLGATLVMNHGWVKVMKFSTMSSSFADPFGVGSKWSLGLAIFAEVVCGALLALGVVTRFAALVVIVMLSVAFVTVHNTRIASGPGSGELAFIYLAGFVTIFIAGPGRFAVDKGA